jgi:hypothetical protein
MVKPWPIELDGLPIKNGGSFHGYVSHNQRVTHWEMTKNTTNSKRINVHGLLIIGVGHHLGRLTHYLSREPPILSQPGFLERCGHDQ